MRHRHPNETLGVFKLYIKNNLNQSYIFSLTEPYTLLLSISLVLKQKFDHLTKAYYSFL